MHTDLNTATHESSEGPLPSAIWTDWPTEIWAKVFLLLEPCCTPVNYRYSWEARQHRRYHELRMVCRKFSQTFARHPELMTNFFFCKDDASLFLQGLLVWLRANSRVHSLKCYGDSACLGMLLPQLLISPMQLRHISMCSASAATIPCLSAFGQLTSCQLHMPSAGSLDVQSLADLKQLHTLTLNDGIFSSLSLPANLKGLFLRNAEVTCDRQDTAPPALQNLSLALGSQMNLPGIGIGACTALTRLEVNNARGISADSQQDWYETEHKLPETMSTMVSLRNLSVSVTGSQVSLEHFGRIPNLKRLHMLHEHISALTGNVASLSGLQVLKITSFSYAGDIPHMSSVFKTPVALHFSWEKLQGLRIIDITGPLVFGKSVLKVAGLPRLKLFRLAFFRPGDVKTSRHLADLADLLAKQRPDVHVFIDELDHLPLGLLD